MTWLPLILISVLFTSVSSLIQRVMLKDAKHDPIVLSVVFQLVTGLILVVVGFLVSGFDFVGIENVWPNVLIMILLYGIGNVFVFKALSVTEASNFTVIFSLRAFFTMISAFVLLGQRVTFIQIVGSFLIFGSVVLISIKSSKLSFKSPEIFSLLAALCFGLANTNDKVLLENMNLYPYLALAFIPPALFIACIYFRKLPLIRTMSGRKSISTILILCAVYAIGAITFFGALQKVDVASRVTYGESY